MKKKLFVIATIFLFNLFNAQNYNYGTHAGMDLGNGLVSINSKTYYIKESIPGCCTKNVYLEAVDKNGHVIFTKAINNSFDYLRKIIRTKDDQLLIWGRSMQACDVSGFKDFVAKFDTSGTMLFNNYVQASWSYTTSTDIIDITPAKDSSFYLITGTELFHFSKNAVLLSVLQTGLSEMKAFTELSNGNLLIHAKLNTNTVNAIYSPSGDSIVTQQNITSELKKIQVWSGGYLALTLSGEIQNYNSALGLVNTSTLNAAGLKANDFVSRNDSVFVAGTNSAINGPFYGILSSTFSILHFSQPSYKKVNAAGISLSNTGHVNVLTNGVSNQDPMGFTTLYQFPVSNGFSSSRNIGVVEVRDVNSFLRKSGFYYFPVPDVEITVKNFGTDTVRSFYLNYYQPPLICVSMYNKLFQIKIAPGATVGIQTGTISLYNPLYPNTQVTGDQTLNLCFFTTLPDYSNDVDIDDDRACANIVFKLTGIKENSLIDQQIQIAPNPFTSEFKINSEIEMQELELYNSYGRLIRTEIINAKSYTFNDHELSPGIYFMKIKTKKGMATKKLIKD